jgi:Uma2 family endonuclease
LEGTEIRIAINSVEISPIAMIQTPNQIITLEKFLQLPETKPASEYIDGKIIQKPMPQGEHSTIQGELVTAVNAALKPEKVGRAYPELRCTFGGRSIVPDVTVFHWNRIPRTETGRVANVFAIAPDWTIEILSPEQSTTRVIDNIVHCLKHGTQLGWLIDPAESLVMVYTPDRRLEILETAENVLPVPEFAAAIQLTIGELFGWLLA